MNQRTILKQARTEVLAGQDRKKTFETYRSQVRSERHLAMAIASVPHEDRKQKYKGLNNLLAGLLIGAAALKALAALIVFSQHSVFLGVGAVFLGIVVPVAFAVSVLQFNGGMYGLLLLLCGVNILNALLKIGTLGAWVLVDVLILLLIMAAAWAAKSKIFPNIGIFGVKKDASGKFIL